jgi:hypothetical protein
MHDERLGDQRRLGFPSHTALTVLRTRTALARDIAVAGRSPDLGAGLLAAWSACRRRRRRCGGWAARSASRRATRSIPQTRQPEVAARLQLRPLVTTTGFVRELAAGADLRLPVSGRLGLRLYGALFFSGLRGTVDPQLGLSLALE